MGTVPKASERADDVRDVGIPVSGAPVRYVRVTFGQREEGNILILSEMEIWVKASKAGK
jgi:hypothetical protein